MQYPPRPRLPLSLPCGVVCPMPLLHLAANLLRNDEPQQSIPRALTSVTNLLRDSVALSGPYPEDQSCPAGGACFSCASWFSPASIECPAPGGIYKVYSESPIIPSPRLDRTTRVPTQPSDVQPPPLTPYPRQGIASVGALTPLLGANPSPAPNREAMSTLRLLTSPPPYHALKGLLEPPPQGLIQHTHPTPQQPAG